MNKAVQKEESIGKIRYVNLEKQIEKFYLVADNEKKILLLPWGLMHFKEADSLTQKGISTVNYYTDEYLRQIIGPKDRLFLSNKKVEEKELYLQSVFEPLIDLFLKETKRNLSTKERKIITNQIINELTSEDLYSYFKVPSHKNIEENYIELIKFLNTKLKAIAKDLLMRILGIGNESSSKKPENNN